MKKAAAKEFWYSVGVLALIALCSGLLIGIVRQLTMEVVTPDAYLERTQAALDNSGYTVTELTPTQFGPGDLAQTGVTGFYTAKDDAGETVYVLSAQAEGYNGTINVTVVFEGEVLLHIAMGEHGETQAVFEDLMRKAFLDQFPGRNISYTNWALKKDGGDIDIYTNATFSANGITKAVKNAVQHYLLFLDADTDIYYGMTKTALEESGYTVTGLAPIDFGPGNLSQTGVTGFYAALDDSGETVYVLSAQGKSANSTRPVINTVVVFKGDILIQIAMGEHGETPAFISNIMKPAFFDQFSNVDISDANWALKEDGGDIDLYTGATESADGITQSVKNAVQRYLAFLDTQADDNGAENQGG